MTADKLDVYSAQSTFYLILGVVPFLMLVLMLLRFTPLNEKMILDVLSEIIDDTVMESVERIVANVYHGSVGTVSFATVSSLWTARRAIQGLINGLNSIRRVRENRNTVLLVIRSIVYTILLIVTFVTALGILVVGARFRTTLLKVFPFLSNLGSGLNLILLLLGLALMVMIFAMLYVVLPNGRRTIRSQMPGALFTTAAWWIYTTIYSVYLQLATNLSVVYGGLASVMGTMLWLYYCLYIFFFGAEFNEWLEKPDSFPF